MPHELRLIALVAIRTPKGWVQPGGEFDASYMSKAEVVGHIAKGHVDYTKSKGKEVAGPSPRDTAEAPPKKGGKGK